MFDLTSIKVNKDNPRWISERSFSGLKKSIQRDPEFLKLRPIVIDKDGKVRAGNQRLRALLELGHKEVPDEWVVKAEDLTEEKLRRLMLIDNSPRGMSGEFDTERLSSDFEVPELIEIGFAPEELGIDTELPETEGSQSGSNKKGATVTCPECGCIILAKTGEKVEDLSTN